MGRYQRAYEQMLSKTSTRHAPWFVVPADHKWFTRVAIAELIGDTLAGLDLAFPKPSKGTAGRARGSAPASRSVVIAIVGARG